MEFQGCQQIPAEIISFLVKMLMYKLVKASNRFESHLCDCVFHNLLVRHITLIANKQLVNPLSSISINLLKPLLHIVEGVHVRDIIDNANAVCASIIRGGDCSETLLACSVPLQCC